MQRPESEYVITLTLSIFLTVKILIPRADITLLLFVPHNVCKYLYILCRQYDIKITSASRRELTSTCIHTMNLPLQLRPKPRRSKKRIGTWLDKAG